MRRIGGVFLVQRFNIATGSHLVKKITARGESGFPARFLVLQRRFMEGGRRCYGGGQRGVSGESIWPVRCAPGHLSAIAAVLPDRTALCGKSSRTTRYTWGLVIRGIFPPPILLQGQQERPGQKAHSDVVMPTRPEPAPYLIRGAGLVFVQAHVALLGLELGFNAPAGAAHIGQGLQRCIWGCVGQVVTGLAAVRVLAINRPQEPHQASASWSPAPVGR